MGLLFPCWKCLLSVGDVFLLDSLLVDVFGSWLSGLYYHLLVVFYPSHWAEVSLSGKVIGLLTSGSQDRL